MDSNLSFEFSKVPENSCEATKRVMELLLHGICPVLLRLRSKFRLFEDGYDSEEEDIAKIKNVFMLCTSQIKKCMVNFLDIIKMENKQETNQQDSRKFIFERLTWCITKLLDVEIYLDRFKEDLKPDLSEDPQFTAPMYFVNWIDYTFEILAKLSEDVYRTDYKHDDSIYEEWKESMVDHVTSLHMCLDELLLSAMTLCKYCLPEDQTILRARCQVVLRETKALFGELIIEDISAAVKVTKDKLKLPIMPSNVNMMIDVLKDVLYVLETNTNTALLALVIHCYVNCASPVDVLRNHFNIRKQHFCPCPFINLEEDNACSVIENFDLYNERLHQIGSFAMSCSSDQKRILALRSSLSSLESLDPHLVPSMTTSPSGHHTELLANFWKQEVLEIRNTVFLIVDPIAFVEKCKQYMHDLLLEMRQQNCYDDRDLWVVMNIGRMVYDFFSIYKKYEPEAIAQHEVLDQLLNDVHRAHRECMKVSEIFTKHGTFINKDRINFGREELTIDTLVTRVKLLYSMVKRVYEFIRPKDNDEQLFGEEEVVNCRNVTHTIRTEINTNTYTNCEKQPGPNFTRSVFARTGVQTSTKNIFLSKLTRHLKLKKGVQEELSFSAQVSELFANEEISKFPKRDRSTAGKYSLRKILLSNQRELPFMRKLEKSFPNEIYGDKADGNENQESAFDGAESLQISEILHQINDLTTIISSNETRSKLKAANKTVDVEVSGHELLGDSNVTSDLSCVTQPSSFTTLERISDLDLVESKLSSLRANSDFETHL